MLLRTTNKITLFFLTFIFISSLSHASEECPLEGKWRSNEKATLEQMEKFGKVTERQRVLFTNHFFGKLTIEYSCSEYTTHYEDMIETDGYRIVGRKDDVLEVESSVGIRKIILVDNCYLEPLDGFGFSEVFCRIE